MIDLEFHSPVTAIRLAGLEEYGISLYMKRDDLIHPFISGNKWRKLKYTLREARRQGCDRLVTFGGAWSNHLLATACAGATFGFRTLGFVRGEEAPSNPVLSLCRIFGMELVYVSRADYRDKQAFLRSYMGGMPSSSGVLPRHSFLIEEGGYSETALPGCAELIEELQGPDPLQGGRQLPYDHIFCACGTGTTLAGLAMGLQKFEHAPRLHGVPVLKTADYLHGQIRRLVPQADYDWHADYHFGGYAKTNAALMEFVHAFSSQTGILIEPVYSGKCCYAVVDLIKQGRFAAGERILMIHSGGLTGLLGML